MIHPLLWAILLLAPSADPRPPQHVLRYRTRCTAIRLVEVTNLRAAIFKAAREGTPESGKRAEEAVEEMKKLNVRPLPLASLPLPPRKDDMGVFSPAAEKDGRAGHSVDVLEVVDEDEAIVRAWYVPSVEGAAEADPPEDPTFVDIWVQGVDTRDLKAGKPAAFSQVFHVSGNKSFGTTCGGRSMPLLEVFDFEPFRATGEPARQADPGK